MGIKSGKSLEFWIPQFVRTLLPVLGSVNNYSRKNPRRFYLCRRCIKDSENAGKDFYERGVSEAKAEITLRMPRLLFLFLRSNPASVNSVSGPQQKAKKTIQKYRRNRNNAATGTGFSGKGGSTSRGGGLGLMAPPQPFRRFSR